MTAPLSVRLADRVQRAGARILSLRAGQHADTGLVPSAAAAEAALELTRSHPALIAHCGIFPTAEEGIQIEGRAWRVLFEIELDRNGKLAGTVYGPGEAFTEEQSLADLEARLDWTVAVPRQEWKVLVDFEGPQVIEIDGPEGPVMAMACAPTPDDRLDPEFIVVMPGRDSLTAFRDDLICSRALIMDRGNRLFAGTLDGEVFTMRPFHGDLDERMLPAEGLMWSDLTGTLASIPAPEAVS